MNHIPYKGSGPAMQDLMGGSIEMAVGTLGGLVPLHRDGRLQLLGVATAQRVPTAPDIATVAESAGLAEPFEAMLWNVVAVPRNTPAAVRARLADASRRAMSEPALIARLQEQGMFADLHIGDASATAFVAAETAKWGPIVRELSASLKR